MNRYSIMHSLAQTSLAPCMITMTLFFWTRQILFVMTFACVTGCGALVSSTNAAHQAEELTQQGRYEDAISSYRQHMEDRLAVTNRPEWENPHFYLLRIGDLYLRMEQPQAALAAYQEAKVHGIESGLISDRYRAVANWYIERAQLQAAFDVLKKHRELDSLLFDAMLDRVGRALTNQERSSATK